MLNWDTQVYIRHLFYAEHWKIGTIAQQLSIHPDAVRRAVQTESQAPQLHNASGVAAIADHLKNPRSP